jgi:hypothetical protein
MSESVSDIVTTSAPHLVGVWVFDPLDPDGTERNYLHVDARTVSVAPTESSITLAGSRDPLVEYGESTTVGVTAVITVPFGEEHDAACQWWEDAAENRRAINYRDNRGRLYWVALLGGYSPSDVRVGTTIPVVLQRVGYDESVI